MELLLLADNASSSHPYQAEIFELVENPRLDFSFIDGIVDSEMSKEYTWVETVSQLKELLDVLIKERVFAVDTEQHSLRSFLGFTALIQVHQIIFMLLQFWLSVTQCLLVEI